MTRVVIAVVILAAVAGVVIPLSAHYRGIGFFNQPIIVEATKPIRQVMYCDWNADDDSQRAEETADPRLFDCQEATKEGDRFMARVKFTTSSGPLRSSRVYHRSHLVVYVEFTDGTRACRVVEIPPGLGQEAVTVRVN